MAERKKIVATDMEVPDGLAKRVGGAGMGRYTLKQLDRLSDQEKKDVEVLVLLSSPRVTRGLFETLPNLKVLQSMSAGVDFIDFSAIPADVVVSSNGGAFGEPIAEHVFAMTLYFGRNLVRNHELVRGGTLGHPEDGLFLSRKTIGIIGTGGIGKSVARAAKGFGMRTLGITFPGILLGFIYRFIDFLLNHSFVPESHDAIPSIAGTLAMQALSIVAAAGVILVTRWIYWLIRHREGVGLGDAKLMAMLAAWLGLEGALLSFVIGVVLGAVVAIVLLVAPSVRRDQQRWAQTKMPLGTFLCVGGS